MRGLTVVEMLIAAALFAVSLMIMLGVFPVSARAVRKSQETLIATHLAETQLELARAGSFGNLASFSPQTTTVVVTHNGVDIDYAFEVEQQVSDFGTDSGLKTVVVLVRWASDRQQRTLRMETQIARTIP
ncbi:MAG: hypothetical protein AB1758_15185 [Candidatus Eremiobacterota bacterium]